MTEENISVRIRLQNAGQFISESRGAATAVKGIGSAASMSSRGFRAAGTTLRGFGSGLRSLGSGISGAVGKVKGMTKGLLALAAAYVSLNFAKDAINTTVTLGKETKLLSDTFGIGGKAAGQYAAAAQSVGVESTSLNMGFTQLSKSAEAATGKGKKQAAAYRELGVSQKLLKTHNTQAIFEAAVDGLKKMHGGTGKASDAMTIFGKSFQKLRPLIGGGKTALDELKKKMTEYGATVNPKDTQKYVHAQHDMEGAFLGLKVTLGKQLIPAVTQLIKWFGGFLADGRKGVGVAGILSDVYHGFSMVLSDVFGWFKKNSKLAAIFGGALLALVAPEAAVAAGFGFLYAKSAKFRGVMHDVGNVMGSVASWMQNTGWPMFVNGGKTAVGWFQTNLMPPIMAVFKDLKKTVMTWVHWALAFWKRWGHQIIAFTTPILSKIAGLFRTGVKIFLKIQQVFLSLFRGDWSGAWKDVGQIVNMGWSYIVQLFNLIGPLLWDAVKLIWKGIVTVIKGTFTTMQHVGSSAAKFLFNGVKSVITGIPGFIVGVIKGIPGAIAALASILWDAGKSVFNSFTNGLVSAFSAGAGFIATMAKQFANFVIDILNAGLSNISIPLPSGSISFPSIPHFAKGGVMRQAGLAVVGENGPELRYLPQGSQVIPMQRAEPRNVSMQSMMGGMVAAGGGGDTVVAVHIDGREVARAVGKHVKNKIARR